MRLQQHINEKEMEIVPSGEKKMSIDDAFDKIRVECSDAFEAYQKGHILYRGSYTPGEAKYYKSRKGRASANTKNYYTLVIDNDPRWKKFPKRSESFICSTSQYTAGGYGITHVVFPKNGNRYGVAPEEDFWWSFNKSYQASLNGLNDEFYMFLKERLGLTGKHLQDPRTYQQLVSTFKAFDKKFKESHIDPRTYTHLELMMMYKGDMLKTFKEILDPKKNGFKVVNSMKKTDKDSDVEVWVEAPVYMIALKSCVEWFLVYDEESKPQSQKDKELEDYRKELLGDLYDGPEEKPMSTLDLFMRGK